MAPVGEVYFPPLDRCFSGEQYLLSWKTTYTTLLERENGYESAPLQKFFADPQTVTLLAQCLSPYPVPTPQTKSSFETKTSAINVTRSPHARYNINQIQDDVIWLSKETNIDEVSALRIAVLEWQTRSADQLLRGSPGDQAVVAAGKRGPAQFQSSIFDPGSSLLGGSKVAGIKGSAFEEPSTRHQRLLETYLSERQFLLKTSEYVTFSALNQERNASEEILNEENDGLCWLENSGAAVLSTWKINGNAREHHRDFQITTVDSIRSRLENLTKGSGWLQHDGVQEDIEIGWSSNQIVEILHIMQILLNLLETSSDILQSPTILAWYRLMDDYQFFETFRVPYPARQGVYNVPIQSLAALISLAALKTPLALNLLAQTAVSGVSAAADAPYLLDSAAVNEMNDIFIAAAPLKTPSPAVLAWGIIMQSLREGALNIRESREIRQSLLAVDRFGAADSSDTDGEKSSNVNRGPLRRRSSTGSDASQQSTMLEEIYDMVAIASVDGDPIAYLATNAVDHGKVFDVFEAISIGYCTPFGFEHEDRSSWRMRGILLDLIRVGLDFIEYQPRLITATLAILIGAERFWDNVHRPMRIDKHNLAARFMKDKVLFQRLFLNAQLRFPYESWPYLQFCQALTLDNNNSIQDGEPRMWTMLDELDTFTCLMAKDFHEYEIVRTQEEIDHIQLTGDLTFKIGSTLGGALGQQSMSRDLKRSSSRYASGSQNLVLRKDTQGEIINSAKPFVVVWNHNYSCLKYLGTVLQCASGSSDIPTDLSSSHCTPTVIENIIGLLTYMLAVVAKKSSPKWTMGKAVETAQTILASASDGLNRNQDVVSVILEILERELYMSRKISEDPESIGILIQCLQFSYALLPLMPDRVWPFLGRSGLLGIDKNENQLSIIVATHEMIRGQYDFLLSCVHLFDALVEDAVTHAVSRKAPSKSVARFGNVQSTGAGVSQAAMEIVLLNFTRIMLEVFESTMNWRFIIEEDRMELNFRLCTTFRKILDYSFEVDDNPSLSQKLTRALSPSAEYLNEVLLSKSNNDVIVLPLLHVLNEGAVTSSTSLPSRGSRYKVLQVVAVLDLISTLVRVNRLLNGPWSHLEDQMLKAASMLCKVYTSHESHKLPVISVLDALIRSAAATQEQPPSLLGHLGQETASHFLEVLSMLDQPLNNANLASAIWRMLSAIVSKRQQWFAVFVLTGSTPRETFEEKAKTAGSSSGRIEPILTVALDSLSIIQKLEPEKALPMLEFVTLAADFWPWVLPIMEKHGRFLRAISEYASHIGLKAASSREGSHRLSSDYKSIQLASYVADLLSMYAYYTQQIGDQNFAKGLVPYLTYLITNAISIPSYNASLHSNLRKNFVVKFPGCSLANFKRTTIVIPRLGETFYYHLKMTDKMLDYDPAWNGDKGQGFLEEVKRANLNLSVVEAQINLFHSWKSLLVELSGPLAVQPKFQKIMAVGVTDCLKANAENSLPETIFQRLAQSRADLAFTLMQRLLETKSTATEVRNILPEAWNTLRKKSLIVESALEANDAEYYRTLLRILYLSLQLNTMGNNGATGNINSPQTVNDSVQRWSSTTESTLRIALEILTTIVAQGFRSLTIILHDKPNLVHPVDFSLITAILRSILIVPGVDRNTAHLITAFSEAQTARCASTLLSWSDQLATSGDPLYGEYSIQFLLEMSSIPTLAESLAVEGVLTNVLSTNLIRLLQSRAFGPFDQPLRMYNIWSRGLLPLLLNLLTALGPPIGSEIATVLNSFPSQLARASSVFGTDSRTKVEADYVTLSMASEAQSLSLVVTILEKFREAGASASVVASDIEEVKWNRVQIKEDAESWLQTREALRERLVASNETEEAWSRAKPAQYDGVSQNRLEEKIVDEMRSTVAILSNQIADC